MMDIMILASLYVAWYIKITITYIRIKLNEKEDETNT